MPASPDDLSPRAGVLIDRAGPEDADCLAELFARIDSEASVEQLRARLGRHAGDERCASWVARDAEGRVLGFASALLIYPIDRDAPTALLVALVTHREHRGKGVSGAMMTAFDAWAQEAGAALAVVSSGQHRGGSHRSYEHFGFVKTGSRYDKSYR